MSHTVVVFNKGAFDDVEKFRASVKDTPMSEWPTVIAHNPGFSLRIQHFLTPPAAIICRGAVDDTDALWRELHEHVAVVELNPGFDIELLER